MDDKSLLHRLRRGDESVLPELIRQYSGFAYAVASNVLSRVLGEEDIEEVVADSFFSVWENRRSIETEKLKAYLAAVVRNKAKTALRKHHAEEPLEDDALLISIPNQPERKILLSELRETAHDAVDSLDETDREIFLRHYFLYQKTEDISRELGLKDATVRARLSRGRKRLKEYLTERGFSCEDTHY